MCCCKPPTIYFGCVRRPAARFSSHRLVLPQCLSGDQIRNLFCDPEGTFWAGTENGIDRWDGARFTYADALLSPALIGGVLAINGGRIARLLVSTESQGIYALRNGTATRSNADSARQLERASEIGAAFSLVSFPGRALSCRSVSTFARPNRLPKVRPLLECRIILSETPVCPT